MQRAQDKIADMQARAGAIDELLASGALTDLSSSTDDIQAQLDKVAATSRSSAELAALKSELAASRRRPPVAAGAGRPSAEARPPSRRPGRSGDVTHPTPSPPTNPR